MSAFLGHELLIIGGGEQRVELGQCESRQSRAGAGFNTIGGSNIDVRPAFLCGAGAVGIAWGQMPTPRTDPDKDYGFRPGVAIEELLGVKKINFNGVQNGIVTVILAAASD